MTIKPKLSTAIACRVVGLDRDRFNEAVSAGFFKCAPTTVAGRPRYFDPDDMVTLRLYRDLLADGFTKERAGYVACCVGAAARCNPKADTVSFVNDYFAGKGEAYPSDEVPGTEKWTEPCFNGTDIRSVTTFNIAKVRELNALYTEEELSYHGTDD